MNKTVIKIARRPFMQKILVTLRRLHDFCCDHALNVNTRGYLRFRDEFSTNKDGLHYEYTPYYILGMIFRRIPLYENEVFADYGCGKGRVVCFASRFPFKRVIGLEFNPELAAAARKNSAIVRGLKASVDVIETDVIHFDCRDVTVFFCFNSFGLKTTQDVLKSIHKSLFQRPRKIMIILYNPLQSEALSQCPWLKQNDWLGFEAITSCEAKKRPYVEFYENIAS